MVRQWLRTKDLADSAGISVQQVRNYESGGFLPIAERSPAGYRRYTQQHVDAMHCARLLRHCMGWPRAQAIMGAVHADRMDEVPPLIDARHAELAGLRAQLEQTQAALRLIIDQLPPDPHGRRPKALRAGEAAALVGVRVSAVRFWEQQGLLHPSRDRESNYRLYDDRELRRLRIVALLRQTNHDFDAIRATLAQLESGQAQAALTAIAQRSEHLTRVGWQCIEATAALYAYVRSYVAAMPP